MPTNYGLYNNQGFNFGTVSVCYSLQLLDTYNETIIKSLLFNAPPQLAATLTPLEYGGSQPSSYDGSFMMSNEQVEGVASPPISDSYQPNSSGHGSTRGRLWREGRAFTLEFDVYPSADPDPAVATERLDAIYQLMQALEVSGSTGQFQLVFAQTTLDSSGVTDQHWFSKVDLIDVKISGGVPKSVMLQLRSQDPRMYGLEGSSSLIDFMAGTKQQEEVFTIDGTGSGGGLVFPLVFPLVFGASGTGVAEEGLSVNARGIVPIDIIIEGEIENPKLYNQSSGKHLDINYSLAAGDVLRVIDSGGDDPQITLNGTGDLYYTAAGSGSEFFGLLPQQLNTIALIADSYDPATAGLTIRWNPVDW